MHLRLAGLKPDQSQITVLEIFMFACVLLLVFGCCMQKMVTQILHLFLISSDGANFSTHRPCVMTECVLVVKCGLEKDVSTLGLRLCKKV